jgi:hypothetical protein
MSLSVLKRATVIVISGGIKAWWTTSWPRAATRGGRHRPPVRLPRRRQIVVSATPRQSDLPAPVFLPVQNEVLRRLPREGEVGLGKNDLAFPKGAKIKKEIEEAKVKPQCTVHYIDLLREAYAHLPKGN